VERLVYQVIDGLSRRQDRQVLQLVHHVSSPIDTT
jgi:hypothetical protein